MAGRRVLFFDGVGIDSNCEVFLSKMQFIELYLSTTSFVFLNTDANGPKSIGAGDRRWRQKVESGPALLGGRKRDVVRRDDLSRGNAVACRRTRALLASPSPLTRRLLLRTLLLRRTPIVDGRLSLRGHDDTRVHTAGNTRARVLS